MIRTILCLYLSMASAVSAEVTARMEAAFRSWVAEVGADAAVLTISHKGVWQKDVAIGMSADAPVELASLSKAVTALCAAQLISGGAWQSDTTSKGVLGHGPAGITVAALMTHTNGLAPDQTQTLMPLWLDSKEDRAAQSAGIALGRGVQTGTPDSYGYNNENYAILGAMIASETGQPYATYCKKTVLDPAGVTTARLSPRSGGMAAWGGWQMSVQDYARLMQWAYGPDGFVGRAPNDWPQAAMGGGVSYGVGMVQRAFDGSMNYWHFGALCFPGRMNAGTFAVRWMQEWAAVVAYDRCLDWDDMVRLDSVLARAVFP